jgi:hypothetical protein
MILFERMLSTLEMINISDTRNFNWIAKYPNIINYCCSLLFRIGENTYNDILRGGFSIQKENNLIYDGYNVNEILPSINTLKRYIPKFETSIEPNFQSRSY